MATLSHRGEDHTPFSRRPLRIDVALANVTTLLTPVPARPSINIQSEAAIDMHSATQSVSPQRRLPSPQRAAAAGAHLPMQFALTAERKKYTALNALTSSVKHGG